MGGSKRGGRKGGGKGDRSDGYRDRQKEARERQWAEEREWDRETFPRRRGEHDIWDAQPTFKVIPELEDRRAQSQLEEILTAAEDKLTSLRAQLADSSKLAEQQESVKAELQAKVDALIAERQTKQDALLEMDAQMSAGKNVSQQIKDKIKALHDEKETIRQTKRDKYKEHGLHHKSVPTEAEAKKRIREVEQNMETCRSLSRTAERQYMSEIRKLENVRYVIKDLERLDAHVQNKDDEIKLCKKELTDLEEERRSWVEKRDAMKESVNAVTKQITAAKREMQQASNQDVSGQERRQTDFVELMTHKVGYSAAKGKFTRALDEWILEKDDYISRRRDEEHILSARQDKWKEQQERRDQALAKRKENPWVQEKAAVEALTQYIEHLVPKAVREAAVAAAAADTAAPSDEADGPTPPEEPAAPKDDPQEGDAAAQGDSRANGQPPEGATIIHDPKGEKKGDLGDKDDWLFADRTKEIKASKAKSGDKKDDKLKHDLESLNNFNTLKMPFPSTTSDAVVALEQLKKRKEWLQTAAYDAPMPDWRPGHEDGRRERGGKRRGGKGKGGGKGGKGGKGDRRGGGGDRDRQPRKEKEEKAANVNSDDW